MTFWERSNDLGTLEVVEVFEYYDQPVLLACRSASGVLYVVVAVDADKEKEQWLCVALSQRRFESVRSGAIDLRTAFGSPEDGIAIHVTAPRNAKSRVSAAHLLASEVPEEWLPAPQAKLTLSTDTLPKLADGIRDHAHQTQRDILGIKLDVIGTTRNEVPAGVIGRVLQSVQATVGAFVQYGLDVKPHGRRSAPYPELMLVAAGGGSFEVRLASPEQTDVLFNVTDSALAKATRQFGELVKLAEDEPEFRSYVRRLPLPIASEYLTFLRAIEGRISKATVEWASPAPSDPHGIAVIHPQSIERAIGAMIDLQETARTFELLGHLIGAHVEKKNYEFVADEAEATSNLERFTGNATPEALNAIRGFGERYRATFDEIRHVKSGGGVELRYLLKKLQPLTETAT